MDEMDTAEQMAYDLERAQMARYRLARGIEAQFWSTKERFIFNTIKDHREQSMTYHPYNER